MNSSGWLRWVQIALLSACMAAAVQLCPAAENQGAQYFGHQQVAAGFAKGGYLVPWVNGSYSVMTARRDKAGEVELHTRDTDVIYVVEGSATFVTGGKMIGGHQTAPGEMRGSSIEGGETHHLSQGDVLVIPANTPHWFKEVPGHMLYFVVKVRQK